MQGGEFALVSLVIILFGQGAAIVWFIEGQVSLNFEHHLEESLTV